MLKFNVLAEINIVVTKKWIEKLTLFFSSALLGIWAISNTIALRNILLTLTVFLVVIYFYILIKVENKANWNYYHILFKENILVPLIFFSLYVWIILHLLLFSRYQSLQIHEFSSTWIRVLLSAISGFGIGLIIKDKNHYFPFLFTGVFVTLCINSLQELLLIYGFINSRSSFTYTGKINSVLMWTIYSSAIAGWLLNKSKEMSNFLLSTYIASLFFCLYTFVFILNTKNGFFVFSMISAMILVYLCIKRYEFFVLEKLNYKIKKIIILILILLVFILFLKRHLINSNEWLNFFGDLEIGFDISKYHHWINPSAWGYPVDDSGRHVAASTYERVAWARAGFEMLLENPLGVGILKNPFSILLLNMHPNASIFISSTHSGFLELSLAFGIPGIFFILSIFLVNFYESYRNRHHFFGGICLLMLFALFLIYAIGELSNNHAIEILFFVLALITAIQTRLK